MYNYILYHPPRKCLYINEMGQVYHDSFSGNQDPYIWNSPFLHSFCHITQIKKEIGQIIFWASRGEKDSYPYFDHLFCDLVFKVKSLHEWQDCNDISINDSIVDNYPAYENHYKWVKQHLFKGVKQPKKRITIKACEKSSFQPQNETQELIDIVPFLKGKGVSIEQLRNSISLNSNKRPAIPSRPLNLNEKTTKELYDYLASSKRKLYGIDLMDKYPLRGKPAHNSTYPQ